MIPFDNTANDEWLFGVHGNTIRDPGAGNTSLLAVGGKDISGSSRETGTTTHLPLEDFLLLHYLEQHLVSVMH